MRLLAALLLLVVASTAHAVPVLGLRSPAVNARATAASCTYVAGATLWLDASDAATLTGDPVSSWASKGSVVTPFVSSVNQPARVAAGQNGRNILRFDGTNDVMFSTGVAISNYISASAFTVFTAFNPVACDQNQTAFFDNDNVVSNSAFSGAFCKSTAVAGVGNADSGGADQTTQAMTINAFHQVTTQHTGGNITVSVDSAAAASTASGDTTTLTGVALLAAYNGGSAFSQVDIGEVLIYNTALSAGDITLNNACMKQRWGTP